MSTGARRAIPLILAACLAAGAAPLSVPFIAQQKNGCGAASVAMVMRYWGSRQAPENVYQALYDSERRGIPLAGMKRYLEEAGFRAFTLRGHWTDIQEHLGKGRPITVGLKRNRLKPMHFAVVTGTEGDRVWLNDPTRKKAVGVKLTDFEKQWERADHWMLLSTPLAGA